MPSAKPGNILFEYPNGDPTGDLITMPANKAKFKFQILAKIRPRCSQVKESRGTTNTAKKYNVVHPSYHLIFLFKAKSHMDALSRKSENISY